MVDVPVQGFQKFWVDIQATLIPNVMYEYENILMQIQK
jgi:hypothetical protein